VTDSVLTPAIREVVGRLDRADVLVGIPSSRSAAMTASVVRAAQAGLVLSFPDLRPVLVQTVEGSADGTPEVTVETESGDYVEQILLVRPRNAVRRLSIRQPQVDGVSGKGAAVRTILEVAAALDVEALVLLDSDPRSIVPEWIELLAGPILKGRYDFVSPRYARHKYDGAITNTVTYPLTGALYGQRIRQPGGGDFGLSAKLVRHYLGVMDAWTHDVSGLGIDAWLTTEAVTGGFAICEARLGAKMRDPKDVGADLAPAFREVMTTVLQLAVRHSDEWHHVETSQAVPGYGFERLAEAPPIRMDPVWLLGQFEAGATEFRETWTATLAPGTAAAVLGLAVTATGVGISARDWLNLDRGADIGRLDTATLANAMSTFHFPDDVWARVVYDAIVAAGSGDRPLSEIVAGLVPIWFGRVASLVVEARRAGTDEAEALVERQALVFEALKPELLRRWPAAKHDRTPTQRTALAADNGSGPIRRSA
jgi:hypothetical protein